MSEGQTTGTRSAYIYTSDTGKNYTVLLDDDKAALGGFESGQGSNGALPKRFKLRGVYAQATIGDRVSRIFLPCQDDASFYVSDQSSNVALAGQTYQTTGRRGESFSFIRVRQAATP